MSVCVHVLHSKRLGFGCCGCLLRGLIGDAFDGVRFDRVVEPHRRRYRWASSGFGHVPYHTIDR